MKQPFKELDFFGADDRADYAGRERDVRDLTARVLSSRTTVLYGRSGLGKTSLLWAGLFPALDAQGFHCIYVRVLDSPLKDLAATLASSFDPKLPTAATPNFVLSDQTAGALLREAGQHLPQIGKKALLIVFDQFEEFFTIFRNRHAERYAFVQEIGSFVRDETHDVRVMFSLREDYLYALDDFQRQLPGLFRSAHRLLPLSSYDARAAIVQPLEERKIEYDDRLVTALLDALAEFEFESAHLQLLAAETFAKVAAQAGDGAVSLFELASPEEVEAIRLNGAKGVFRRFLTTAIEQIPEALRMDARTLLDVLITESGTKLARSLVELCATRIAAEERIVAVLTLLEKSRLVRCSEPHGTAYYEIRHECLIHEIRLWQKEDPPFAEFLDARDAIRNYGRDTEFRARPARLLSADMLRQSVSPNADRLKLTPQELEFVLWSAIRNRAEDTVVWAQRYEMAQGSLIVAVLTEIIQHPNVDLRAGAARAIPLLAPDEAELVRACFDLCLNRQEETAIRIQAIPGALLAARLDPGGERTRSFLDLALADTNLEGSEWRTAAIAEFARTATPAQTRTFARRVRLLRNGGPVVDVLGTFYAQHRRLPSKTSSYSILKWRHRRLARKAWESQRLQEHATQLRDCHGVSTRIGMTAGLFFMIGLVIPVTFVLGALENPISRFDFGFNCLLLGSFLSGIACLVAWRGAYAVAECQAISGTVRTLATSRRASLVYWICAIPLWAVGEELWPAVKYDVLQNLGLAEVLYQDAIGIIVVVLGALLTAHLARPCLALIASFIDRCAECSRLTITMGFTLLLGTVAFWGGLAAATGRIPVFSKIAWFGTSRNGEIFLLSTLAIFVAVTFGFAAALRGLTTEQLVNRSRSRRWPVLTASLTTVLLILWCLQCYGPHRFAAFFSPPVFSEDPCTIPLSPPGTIGADYYRLRTTTELLDYRDKTDQRAMLGGVPLRRAGFVFLPDRTARIAFGSMWLRANSQHGVPQTLSFQSCAPLPPIAGEPVTEESRRGWLTFVKTADGWKCSENLSTRDPDAGRFSLLWIRIFPSALTAADSNLVAGGILSGDGLGWTLERKTAPFPLNVPLKAKVTVEETSPSVLIGFRFQKGMAHVELTISGRKGSLGDNSRTVSLLATVNLGKTARGARVEFSRRMLGRDGQGYFPDPEWTALKNFHKAAIACLNLGDIEAGDGAREAAIHYFEQAKKYCSQALEAPSEPLKLMRYDPEGVDYNTEESAHAACLDTEARAAWRLGESKNAIQFWQQSGSLNNYRRSIDSENEFERAKAGKPFIPPAPEL